MKLRQYFNGLKLNIKFTIVIIIAILIPIAVFAGVLFYNLEQNVIDTNLSNIQYKSEQATANIDYCIDSINMATQYFLMDEEMKEVLVGASKGETLTADEIVEFQDQDVKNLERLVSNNPLLYSVRVFSSTDNVQEMMQILYKHKRSEKLSWYDMDSRDGWHFGVVDEAFSTLLINQDDQMTCLITPIVDYKAGEVGVIEASMKMETMFPYLYEDKENELNCFVTDSGEFFYGGLEDEGKMAAIDDIWAIQKENADSINYIIIGGRKLVVASIYKRELNGTLLFIKDISKEVQTIYTSRNQFIVMMIILLVFISFLINHVVNKMLNQFYLILKSIREVQHGNLDARIEKISDDEMGELTIQLNTMLDRVNVLMKENIGREVMAKDSELKALQNQINAHFIYNVLESIKMMAEVDEEYEISDSITALGKLLRYSMRWVSGNVKVSEEIDYIKNYMALINLRYDFVVTLSVNIPENLMGQEIPKMSLQPIVENAILHGIDPVGVDSTIYIKGISDGRDFIIEISDTGKGMTEEERVLLEKKIHGEIAYTPSKGNGIGLNNVNNRITMLFGEEYGISVESQVNCYTKVSVKLPYRKQEVG